MDESTKITSDVHISLTVEFTGGLEMLFDNITAHKISVSDKNKQDNAFTVGDLIPWLCENLMKDSRKELFVLDKNIRPGILVLINEADWELEGEDGYELKEGDKILFVSTLHGG